MICRFVTREGWERWAEVKDYAPVWRVPWDVDKTPEYFSAYVDGGYSKYLHMTTKDFILREYRHNSGRTEFVYVEDGATCPDLVEGYYLLNQARDMVRKTDHRVLRPPVRGPDRGRAGGVSSRVEALRTEVRSDSGCGGLRDAMREVQRNGVCEDMMTVEKLHSVLAKVTFAPSCVDMGWTWEVRPEFPGRGLEPCGFLIRTTFRRPDRDTGAIETGYGRWWHVPADVSESGIVKTAYAAARMILEHELMESFRYDGVRLFDPHHDIEDLRAAAKHHARAQEGLV